MGISLVIKRWVSLASLRIVTNLLYLKYSGYECIHVIELEKNSQQQRIKRFPCSMVTTRSMFISVSSGRETKTKPRWKVPFTVSQCNFRQLSSPCELAEWTNNMWEDIHIGSHFLKKSKCSCEWWFFGAQRKEAAKGAGIEVTSGDDQVSGFTEPPQLEEWDQSHTPLQYLHTQSSAPWHVESIRHAHLHQ